MNLWPHQQRAIDDILTAIARGERRICLAAPCGSGKSLIMRRLTQHFAAQDWKVVLYINRKLLREQITAGLDGDGIEHGIRASGHAFSYWQQVQVSSIQTEDRRVYKTGSWSLHDAQLVFVDEAHINRSGVAEKIINEHVSKGAVVIGPTATPVSLSHLYTHLVSAGTNSELRKCGAHLPCHTYGPDEPSLQDIGPVNIGDDLSESQNVKAIMRPGIFGRVYKHWKTLNPDARPAILFGPGVGESLWFAQEFRSKGVKAAHIDAQHIWIDGEQHTTTPELREQVLADVRSGDIKIIANRWVMREGVDIPELYHCILACVLGSVSTYLQCAGRVVRYHSSLPGHVILQDHGGNFLRHGSINADRQWHLSDTDRSIATDRVNRLREKKEQEPITCPQCFQVRASGPICKACGYETNRKTRMVVQKDGKLIPYSGDVYKPRVTKETPEDEKRWKQQYYRAKNGKLTFSQAYALFRKEWGYYPRRDLDLMPKDELGWSRKVKDVAYTELRKSEKDLELFQ